MQRTGYLTIPPTYTADAISVLIKLHTPPYRYCICFTEKPGINLTIRADSQEEAMHEIRAAELKLFGSSRIDPVALRPRAATPDVDFAIGTPPSTRTRRSRSKVKAESW